MVCYLEQGRSNTNCMHTCYSVIKTQLMFKSATFIIIALCFIVCSSCNNNKPKPESNDITKTAVNVNGKKDSVINNPNKNYGNATVADPCVKCLIKIVQATHEYNMVMVNKRASAVNYVVNWDRDNNKADSITKNSVINSLRIDVVEKGEAKNKIATFKYDNKLSKLLFVGEDAVIDIKISAADLKMVRNKCFWGVASAK